MKLLFMLCLLFLTLGSYASTSNNFTFISHVQEQRYQHLLGNLRCLVCQNQSLAESNAPLAQDLKKEVRDKIVAGYTDEEIKLYLVAHYGEYILFKPSVNRTTIILWSGPFIFLMGALFILFASIKKQARVCSN